MLVIDKPAGLPVHPGPRGGETLADHLDALRFGLPRRPQDAHRLGLGPTGGLLLRRHPRTGSTATPPAASSSAATPPPCAGSERCSGRVRSTRSTGRWSRTPRR